MARVLIVGDGPAGLSAGLFLAKNGQQAVIVGEDETAMHYAELHNYLGIDVEGGSDFQARVRRQVADHGAELRSGAVGELADDGDGFRATLDSGDTLTADYLILAAGKAGAGLAEQVGVQAGRDGIEVDTEYRTGVDGVYAVGRTARPHRSQAIISAGAGAVAALDVLSREEGRDVHDWDTPEDGT